MISYNVRNMNDHYHCIFSIIIAVDPPPPLHIPTSPYFPPLIRITVNKLCTILAPLIPIGCPIATAPPNAFTFYFGSFSISIIARGTTENASLNS